MRNSEVAEDWYRHGKAKGSNFFTDGTTIWSYGKHFPIAHRTEGKVYFNEDGYSVSTSAQIGYVARALGYDNRKDILKNHDDYIYPVDTETLIKIVDGMCPPDKECRDCPDGLKGIVGECNKAIKVT